MPLWRQRMHCLRERAIVNLAASRQRRVFLVRVFGSVGLIVGGVLIAVAPLISNDTFGGFLAIMVCQFVGFALLLVGSILISTKAATVGRALLIAASSLAFFGWTWFLHAGLFFYVPMWIWSAGAALLFLSAGVAFAVSREPVLSVIGLVFFSGYLWSAIVAFESPVWPPPYTDLPTSGAAILTGILAWTLKSRIHCRSSWQRAHESGGSGGQVRREG